MKLKMAEDLSLPLDAATQTFAFIARKGAGKTYAAGKLVELLLEAGVQVVVLDTVGNWYGLRLGADGKQAGFDIPVLGGLRGDIPLEAAGGALIADIVVETGRSLVVDMSQFSLADRKRFAAAFGERLWQAKKAERHPSPVHLVIEESQLIVPQDVRGDSAKMVGIFEEIIRLGRNYGIGVSMITQRPQSVNKEVLNQTECLFVGQVNGAQERDALKKWITHQGMDVHLVDELPGLKVGTFYVWSPQWLNLLERVRILPKVTFDASATPKVGDKRVQRELKPLDLSELQEKLKATIEKAKADDPRELRKQLLEKDREIATLKKTAPATSTKTVEKFVLKDGQLARAEKLSDSLDALLGRVEDIREKLNTDRMALTADLTTISRAIADAIAATRAPQQNTPAMMTQRVGRQVPVSSQGRRVAPAPATSRPASLVSPSSNGDGEVRLNRLAERKVLQVLVQYGSRTKRQLAIQAGYAANGGGFNGALSKLKTAGYIVTEPSGLVAATTEGAAAIGDVEPLPSGAALVAHWMQQFNRLAEREVLRVVVEAYPHALTAEDVASRTNPQYEPKGGGFNGAVSKLRTLGLISGRGELKASDELFD